jgi:hypothetical protein
MKFRTEIPVNEHTSKLNYQDEVLFLGSCFSVHIHDKMKGLKFNSLSNPFGIVYNPLSLSSHLLRVVSNEIYTEQDLHFYNERWFSFNHHSDFSFSTKSECLTAINNSLEEAHQQLKSAKFLFITLGSSWVYFKNEDNEVVSNCHKIPAKKFTKFLAEPEDMVAQLSHAISELKKINQEISIIFGVSPVRHLADGHFENQVSKGRLFDVIHHLTENDDAISYFPSYELLMDDLRDYRFYKSDLVHPSNNAIQYIWERFVATFFSDSTVNTMSKVEKLIQAANHRPFNPKSEAHQKFIVKTISSMENLEKEVFGGFKEEKIKLKG